MTIKKILVCGSRGKYKDYKEKVYSIMREKLYNDNTIFPDGIMFIIIEGCCPNSADEYAEEFCEETKITIRHYPAKEGKYLERDRQMAEDCDEVVAFWNGISRGTLYTLTQAILRNKPVNIIPLQEAK